MTSHSHDPPQLPKIDTGEDKKTSGRSGLKSVRKNPIELLPESWAAAIVVWIKQRRNPIAILMSRLPAGKRWRKRKPEKAVAGNAELARNNQNASSGATAGEPIKKNAHEELRELLWSFLPPWLLSFGVHLLLLILLSLLLFRPPSDASIHLTIEIAQWIPPESKVVEEPLLLLGGTPDADPDKIDDMDKQAEQSVEDPLSAPPVAVPVQEIGPVVATDTVPDALLSPLSFRGRNPGDRDAYLAAGGGGPGTETAVVRGLDWLLKVQRPAGNWSLAGPYADGIESASYRKDNTIAATAMALLALQGYGITPHLKDIRFKKYIDATTKGWKWLLLRQMDSGSFFRDGDGTYEHRFYTQGLCTIAICELYGMSGVEDYREPAERAVAYCLENQSVSGGWKYHPAPQSPAADVSVTGWIVLALQSARAAGLDVPQENLDRISAFLDTTANEDGSRYRYMHAPGEKFTRSMTAEALTCRILLGWRQDDKRLRAGLDWITEERNLIRFDEPKNRDVYYWYYATQALHHFGGEHWAAWNEAMRTELPRYQEMTGRDAGSWSPRRPVSDEWGIAYGRLYTTCFSLYLLESYYRHERVYRDD